MFLYDYNYVDFYLCLLLLVEFYANEEILLIICIYLNYLIFAQLRLLQLVSKRGDPFAPTKEQLPALLSSFAVTFAVDAPRAGFGFEHVAGPLSTNLCDGIIYSSNLNQYRGGKSGDFFERYENGTSAELFLICLFSALSLGSQLSALSRPPALDPKLNIQLSFF